MSQNDIKPSADAQRHGQDPTDELAQESPAVRKWQIAKRVMWMLLLAAAFLAYYLMDRMNEALSILK